MRGYKEESEIPREREGEKWGRRRR